MKEEAIFKLLFKVGDALPFHWLKRASHLPVIPLYHAVSEHPSVYVKHVNVWRSLDQFKADLDFYLKYYEPVSLEDLYNGKKTRKTPLHLTFDDGLKECCDDVIPILKEKGIPASFFLNSAFVDNRDLFFRFKASVLIEYLDGNSDAQNECIDFLNKRGKKNFASLKQYLLSVTYLEKEILDDLAGPLSLDYKQKLSQQACYMTSEEARSIQSQGFTIGAHSIDHPRYDALPLEEQLRQTIQSLKFVQDKYAPTLPSFAFPFTDFRISKRFFQELSASKTCKISFGCAGLKKENIENHFQRVPMDENSLSAKANLSKEYLYYLLKAPIGKNVFRRGEL
ncbi:MAG: polysaccharide deacetylase family protein [Chitinophagales bacterium]|nr:polysaccharide deacetylase family protein [Chitinophagales bacterium]